MMVGKNSGSQETANRLPRNSKGAEIGVWVGDTSKKFLKRGLAALHLVDAWSPDVWFDLLPADEQAAMLNRYSGVTGGATRAAMVDHYDKVAYHVIERFREHNNVTIHRMDSKIWLKEFNETLDWIYVDGDHSYEGCLSDLEDCLRIVKKDGFIFADDYGNKPEVKKAIDHFCDNHNFSFEVYAVNQVQITLK